MDQETRQEFEKVHEQFALTNTALHKHDERFEQIDQRFEQIDQRFEQVDQRFEQVDQRFDRLEQRIHETQLLGEDTNAKVQAILEVVTKNDRQYVSRQEFDTSRQNHENRIAAIEHAIRK